ncbi:uncharacterized protein GIQ15_02813 [Arthroderma uncinatum]|uniref:uncharacterized protein n=1 Tax=Arthroderma uncinatum TaxID=74035 RepID=UPI00144ABACD|nr:uncharacterized protein GIQ15_02813 [Arthroderma uncinatum]KAF3483489.1 hypothetical protein GIQ15_02813 [Arthroderma uncinatum]
MDNRAITMEQKESGASSKQSSQGSELVLFTPNNDPQNKEGQPHEKALSRICHSPKPLSPTSPSSASSSTSRSSSVIVPLSELNPNIFEVLTVKAGVESGFSYHQRLFENHVPPTDWKRFSDELVAAFALTTLEKIAAWTVGISVGLVSAVPLLVFGAAPGYYAGKAVNSMSIETKVHDYLQDEGELVTVLRNWNNTFFKSKGLYVKLALPRKKSKEGPKSAGGTFDSIMPFGSKRKGKGKRGSQDGDGDVDVDKKEGKKLDKRYRLIIENVGIEQKQKPWVEHDNNIPLPKDMMELQGNNGPIAAPTYSPQGPPPYKCGTHPAELEPASATRAAELDVGPKGGVTAELDGGNSVAELPGVPRKPVYELA